MASLAFSHPAVPTSLGYGFCEVRTSGEQLIVDQADPRILVTRELLARALREGTHPAVTISVCPSGWVCHAVLAPGSKVTLAPCTDAGSGA